jgi:hypothetical protein
MTHSIEININPPEINTVNQLEAGLDGIVKEKARAAAGYDVDLKIDGKRFAAASLTLEAKAGRSLVEATVTFGVNDLKLNGKNVETAFKIIDPDGGAHLTITKDQYAKVLEFTKTLLENE